MGSKPLLMLVVASIACAVALMFVVFSEQPDQPAKLEPGAGSAITDADHGAAAKENGTAERAIVTEKFSEEPRRKEDATGIRLQVVAKDGGQALPGAAVTFTDNEALRAATEKWRLAEKVKPEPRREQFTSQFTSDGQGIVVLPVFVGRAWLEGRLGPLWGRCWVSKPQDKPLVLELSTDRELRVKVVDAQGVPQENVPVVLRLPNPRSSGIQTGFGADTGPDGVALLSHVQLNLAWKSGWEVTLGFPILDPPTIPVSEETLGATGLKLTMPPTGRLVIRCVDLEGRPVGNKASLRLTAHDGDPEGFTDLWPRAPWNSPAWNEQGDARLPLVGLGIQFRAELKARDRSSGIQAAVGMGAGPTEPGQTATITVVFGRDRFPVVTGRVVRQDGQPLPACHLAALDRIKPDKRTDRTWQKVAVDEGGRFRLVIRHRVPQNGSYTCQLQELAADDGWRENPPTISLDVSEFTMPEDYEIGDLILDYGSLLVAGRVVDQNGHVLEDADVTVMEKRFVNGFGSLKGCVFIRAPDGGFRLHAQQGRAFPQKELRLSARHSMALPRRGLQEFTIGATGVRIVLPLGGALAGSVKFDAENKTPEITGMVYSSDGRRHVFSLRPEGRFKASRLHAGPVTLVLMTRGGDPQVTEDVLVRIENIQIRAGEVNNDPRLQGIILPTGMDSITLTLKDPYGDPLSGAEVYDADENQRRMLGRSGSDGEVRVPLRPGGRDLTIVAKGYRALVLKGVSADTAVTLNYALRVELEVVGIPPRSSLDTSLHLRLAPHDSTVQGRARLSVSSPRFRSVVAGKIPFELPKPGTYRVWWYAGSRRRTVQEKAPQTILVADTKEEQTFIVTVPVAAIRASIAAKDG